MTESQLRFLMVAIAEGDESRVRRALRETPELTAAAIEHDAPRTDPEATNRDGATPLHRAIRSRCSLAVATLLQAGASPVRPNGNGSSPMQLATHATGRGGSGAPAAKREQAAIIRLLTASAQDTS